MVSNQLQLTIEAQITSIKEERKVKAEELKEKLNELFNLSEKNEEEAMSTN